MPSATYEVWLEQVREALRSINMQMENWQPVWEFDFLREHDAGTAPDEAAMKANRFWWHQQNKSLNKDCPTTPGCWLPRSHPGGCQPVYERGDYIKVEFPDETTGVGEWMWVLVDHTDDKSSLVYGTLDNEPLHDYSSKLKPGSQLAISYDNVREHRKPSDFKPESRRRTSS